MRVTSLVTSYSFRKQSALGTAQTSAGNFRTLAQVNRAIPNITRNKKTNAGEVGAGIHPTQPYRENAILEHPVEGRLSAELASQLFPFAFGSAVESAVGTEGAIQYVMTSNQADSDSLPTFTLYAGLGQGTGEEILDHRFIGVAVDSVSLKVQNGVSIDNASLSAALVGTGRYAANVGFTPPAASTLHLMNPGSITTFTFDPATGTTINFQTNCRVLSSEFTMNNGIKKDSNYRACDASQDGYFVMGRMRRGAPAFAFTAQVEVEAGSTEEEFFLNEMEGALDFKMEGDLVGAGPEKYTIRVQFPRCNIVIESKGDVDDLVVYNLRFEPLYDSVTSAICVVTVIVDIEDIVT